MLDTSDSTWQQVQLSLHYRSFGLWSLSHHSSAAFIASVCSSGFGDRDSQYLVLAITFVTARSFYLLSVINYYVMRNRHPIAHVV